MSADLPVVQPVVQPAQVCVTPMQILANAVANGTSVDQLEKLMALQERWEANEAKKAFVLAMTKFKSHPAVIRKNKEVDFSSQKGRTHYKHATLDNVCDVLGPALSEVGISHRWETEQKDGGMIRVTCILTHSQGHSESVWLQAGRDDTGNKNNIQAVGSTVTYLQRYTLLAATGMAVKDQDDDGQTAEPPKRVSIPLATWDQMTAEQQGDLQAIADQGIEFLEQGKDAEAEAWMVEQVKGLDDQEQIALWSRFDSKQRARIKKIAQERSMKAMKVPTITSAQKSRIEARINEAGADREKVKAWCAQKFNKEHFADLTKSEYDQLDTLLDAKLARDPARAQTAAEEGTL